MNMAANPNKMAVTDNQSTVPVHGSDSREENETKIQGKAIVNDGNFKKKSTFKITSVTKNIGDTSNDVDHDVEHDSNDDLDETVESHTEDASSEILDISKYTDGGEPASPMEEETSDHAGVSVVQPKDITNTASSKDITNKVEHTNTIAKDSTVKDKEKPEQQGPHPTRFKVVKIETREPYKRGRWTCRDTSDYPAPDKSDSKLNITDSNIVAPSNINSVQNVGAVDDSKNIAKPVNVIQGDTGNRDSTHGDTPTRQSQQVGQQIPNTNLPSNIAQQMQTHQSQSNFHNGTGYPQTVPMVNSSFVQQGQVPMQTSDKPQTTYIFKGSNPGQMPNTMQNPLNSADRNIKQDQYKNSDIKNIDNKEIDTVVSRSIGANEQQNSGIDVQNAILTPQSVAEVVGMIPSPQEEDSGSSTVAIDNKIEQAMDLVKSHLMYAVREEVEVLKEQIKELMEKNQQLEYENQILKNSASPETLAKLSNLPPSSSS